MVAQRTCAQRQFQDDVRCPLGKMAASPSHERLSVYQAQQVTRDRLSGGSSVLGMDGLWVHANELRPDLPRWAHRPRRRH